MVSLTSLLVQATFFSQSNQSIPRTSSLKLLDVWYLVLISLNVLMILALVCLENLRLAHNRRKTSNTASPVTSPLVPIQTKTTNNKVHSITTHGVDSDLTVVTTAAEALTEEQNEKSARSTHCFVYSFIDDDNAAKRVNAFLRVFFLLLILGLLINMIFNATQHQWSDKRES